MDKKDIGKMNLKDGFRYQNFLNTLMTEAEYYLCAEEHLFTTTKKHMRQAANPDAEDLTEIVDADNPFDVNDVIQFMISVIAEKEEITAAINKAKTAAEQDIDALTEGNKLRNSLCKQLRTLLKKKGRTQTKSERGFMLNNERNQVSYFYNVEETRTELFDRKSITELYEDASRESSDVSNSIDVLRVTTLLDFTPRFNVNLTFEEVLNKYIADLDKTN